MFRLMRNIHLSLGLIFFSFAFIFAVSSLVIIYRPWLPESYVERIRVIQLEAPYTTSARALALELMRDHGLAGNLNQVNEDGGVVEFQISRPGTRARVEYVRGTSEVKIETRRWGWLDVFTALHRNHGFHHDFLPANAWSLLSLLGSTALILLGISGVYLWFRLYKERLVGSIVLVLGLIVGLANLVWSRIV